MHARANNETPSLKQKNKENGFLFLLEFFSSHIFTALVSSLSLSLPHSLSLATAVPCLLCRHLLSSCCRRLRLQLKDNFPTIFHRQIPISIQLPWSFYPPLPLRLLLILLPLQQQLLLQQLQPMTLIHNPRLWLFPQNVDTSLMFQVLVSNIQLVV